ncbi:MAG: DUF4491 family protein [Muribaculaceae bacterium]|nr:DUF4491 family protein [Muribaculaceae bacterium]
MHCLFRLGRFYPLYYLCLYIIYFLILYKVVTEFLTHYHIAGVLVGLISFLIIGLFHPLVIKGEYYYGTRCKLWFLIAGIVCLGACVIVTDMFISAILGVTSFSCFWSIREIDEQVERVRKGWFPKNPKRKY